MKRKVPLVLLIVVVAAGAGTAAFLIFGRGGSQDSETRAAEVDWRVRKAGDLLLRGRARQALAVIRDVDDPRTRLLRLRANLAMHRWGAAGRALKGYDGPDALKMRCEHAAHTEDVRAVAICKEAVATAPDDPFTVVALATALRRDLRVDQAEQVLKDALEKHSSEPIYYMALADHYEKRTMLPEALSIWEGFLAIAPDDHRARTGLVRALVASGKGGLQTKDPETARDAFQRALEVDPSQTILHWYLAAALDRLGHATEAEAEREKARRAGVPEPDELKESREKGGG